MTRLASHCLKSAVLLALALSLGTAIWAQENAAKAVKPVPARKAHWTTAPKPPAKPSGKRELATGSKPHRGGVARAVSKPATNGGTAPAAAAAAAQATAPAETTPTVDLVGKRDPFVALVNNAKGTTEHLPPGKAGLVISTLTVQGTEQGASGPIAVLANPDQRVYFVREGDRLYDGEVEKISLDGVTFQQNTKDAFGKPIEQMVVKRIYPSAGEQQ